MTIKKALLMTCGLALMMATQTVFGLSSYVSRVPNGSKNSCLTCHDIATGAPDLNPFGSAFAANGHAWNASLAAKDSDGDGASNGLELGDSSGSGTPTAGATVTNPGDPASKPAPTATAPSIATQPASKTVTEGASVTFTVAASGTAPLSFQWMKGGANISGATSATLTLNAVTTASAGSYTVRVSNSAGAITSGAATLTVNAAATAPTIASQPASQTVTAGANVTFTVAASGTAPLSFQWMKGGANISGATSATLTLNAVTITSAGSYTVRVSNSAGAITSGAATLTVNAAATAPTIASQPASQTVTAGANVTFTVAASGTAPLSFQWMKGGANISGATSATLTLNAVTITSAGSYTVRVSNSAGAITSGAATLTVNAAATAPTIASQPASQTVTAGANVTFTVAASGTAPLSFQWMKGGANISGATSATLTLNAVTTASAGSYTVRVSNSAGAITSAAATLTVNAAATAPTIASQPASQTVTAGANVTFTVAASGTAPLSYQWMKGGANISGATSATLTLNAVTTASAGSYTVRVSNSAGAITSGAATLTVNAATTIPTITTQPASQTVNAGASASFSVVASGTTPLSYQWKKNGGTIVGATSATLTLNNVTTADAGGYVVVVSNSAGSATSTAASLTLNPAPVNLSITLSSPTNGASYSAPVDVPVTVVVTPAASATKVEYFDGTNLVGTATAAPFSLVLSNAAAGEHELVARVTDNQNKTATSQPVSFTVTSENPPSDNQAPTVKILMPKDSASFSANTRILIAVNAADADGRVAKVEIFSGSTSLGTATLLRERENDDDEDSDREDSRSSSQSTVYYLVWNRVPSGQYAITAKATDNLGATTTSAPLRLTVKAPMRRSPSRDD